MNQAARYLRSRAKATLKVATNAALMLLAAAFIPIQHGTAGTNTPGIVTHQAEAAPSSLPNPVPETIYVIPIEGPISKSLLYVLRRGLSHARDEAAGGLILTINTPGGQLDVTDEIVRELLATKIPTCAFVQSRALSAGAIIAMATDRIYMAPGSVIGDALPIMVTPFGGVQEMPEAMQEKAVSAVAAMIRSNAQQKGHDPLLAEAMVRREMEYKIGDRVVSPEGQLLTLTDSEAAGVNAETGKPMLSSGTVAGMDELLKAQDWSDARIITLKVTTSEKIARVIESFSVILLAAGLLGLYIEFKTPGFGLPGMIGAICLAVFFWGHHIAGLAGTGEMLMFLIGIALILIEVFFIPGFGMVGVVGILVTLFAFVSAMVPSMPVFDQPAFGFELAQLHAPILKAMGAVTLSGICALLLGRYLPHSRIIHPIMLTTVSGHNPEYSGAADSRERLGQEGVADSALRPAGIGVFDGQRLNIIAQGEYIERGTAIKIIEMAGRRIVVEKV